MLSCCCAPARKKVSEEALAVKLAGRMLSAQGPVAAPGMCALSKLQKSAICLSNCSSAQLGMGQANMIRNREMG